MEYLKHELIGLEAEVLASTCPAHVGVRGRIVNETKNMLYLDVRGAIKGFQKKGMRLRVRINRSFRTIDCSRLRYRPEDRIKKVRV